MSTAEIANTSTIDTNEIAHFTKDSAHWWNLDGPFAPLHKMNPVRMSYILDQIRLHYPSRKITDINVIDIGCGGGLACEPLARLGANVTGVDADEQAIEVAQKHAISGSLDIRYINGASEDIKKQYDVVLALEIIEHVKDPAEFVSQCEQLVKPGGLLIMSTLNRTIKSMLGGVIAAEYVLKWVPQGTHDWKKFIKPSELSRMLRAQNMSVQRVSGICYNPIEDQFALNQNNLSINYLLSATKDIE